MHIKNALISVYSKEGLEPILRHLTESGVTIYSTGGTHSFIEQQGHQVKAVEDLTGYPSILGGRVKTLHPKVFGGILARRQEEQDQNEVAEFEIPHFDLVIVDLYPFEDTLRAGGTHQEIIEKIDIGGISLIRAAAKNFHDVAVIPSMAEYSFLLERLESGSEITLEDRKLLSAKAFRISSAYDNLISSYLAGESAEGFGAGYTAGRSLRYGENPHQKGTYYGRLDDLFEQLHGKELSYNNLLDIDAVLGYIKEFEAPTVAIIKHNNACGLASRDVLADAWADALAGDPVSSFGGVIGVNRPVDEALAKEMNKLFFEVLLAPSYSPEALEILKSKKNRVLLVLKSFVPQNVEFRQLLNGVLVQDKDLKAEAEGDLTTVTKLSPTQEQVDDLLFANKLVKNSKSNTIVLAKNKQLVGIGAGQTSRIDALKQAIAKAQEFGLPLDGAVMASDAFFPFPDCVEIAHKAGIKSVIQPGGSIRDKESIDYCDANQLSMVTTGIRHFKH